MTGLTAATDKVVFTHVGALRAKYGPTGVSRLRAALRTMIANDRGRGWVTTVVDVSSAAALRPVGESRIADPDDHGRFRQVLDVACALAEPDYVLLYGGPDIVPLVPLSNPMPAPDPDPDLPSDLPYAVPSGGSGSSTALDATALVGPTRVVGRLPDTLGAAGLDGAAAYAGLTRTAARWRSVDRVALSDPLCLSTARWQLSTAASAEAVLGPGAAVRLAGPWTGPGLDSGLHLVNLHGATADPHWTGDPGFAPALSAADVDGRRLPGTVAVTESWFGAELWDPELALGVPPLPLAYLAAGAYAVVGPTCLSYGGRTTPDAADVLCWLVAEELLAGASLGRALLTARQRYVAAQPATTPVDLKTLAQFSLLGDPSIHLVTPPAGAPVGARAPIGVDGWWPPGPGCSAVRRCCRPRRSSCLCGAAASVPVPLSCGSRRAGPAPRAGTGESVTEPRTLEGWVSRETYAASSKSEHPALILTTDEGSRYLLRRLGGPAYADPELDALVGHQVSVTGRIHRDVFLLERFEIRA